MCHCIGDLQDFSDVVSPLFFSAFKEHCLTEDVQAVAHEY